MMTTESPVRPAGSELAFLADQAQAERAGTYELLARLLAAPAEQELLQVLASIDSSPAAESGSDADTGPMLVAWEILKQAAQKASPEAVTTEYTDLFIGVGRGELVPFGSWYVTGFLMEKPLAKLRQELQELDIERQEGVSETEDHIAALCDAMAIIIRSGIDRPGESLMFARQQQFFNDHLAPWVNTFCVDLQNANSAHFYRAVAYFGDAFFEFEKRLLSMQR